MKKTVINGTAVCDQVKIYNIHGEGNSGKECEKGIHVAKTETMRKRIQSMNKCLTLEP